MSKQLPLDLPKWGGRRKGAGRPRTRPHPGLIGPGVPHLKRETFPARIPVHVTVRVVPGVGYLRSQGRAKEIATALREALLPGVFVSGSSEAGMAAARTLGATAIKSASSSMITTR